MRPSIRLANAVLLFACECVPLYFKRSSAPLPVFFLLRHSVEAIQPLEPKVDFLVKLKICQILGQKFYRPRRIVIFLLLCYQADSTRFALAGNRHTTVAEGVVSTSIPKGTGAPSYRFHFRPSPSPITRLPDDPQWTPGFSPTSTPPRLLTRLADFRPKRFVSKFGFGRCFYRGSKTDLMKLFLPRIGSR